MTFMSYKYIYDVPLIKETGSVTGEVYIVTVKCIEFSFYSMKNKTKYFSTKMLHTGCIFYLD